MRCRDIWKELFAGQEVWREVGEEEDGRGVFEGKSEGGVSLEYHVVGKGKGLGRG